MNGYDKEALKKFQQAGIILRETRAEIKSFVRENMKIIDICEKTERLIKQKGGTPAFPTNVSVNEIAAHYTSPPKDNSRIPEKALVKVDIGAHVDGYVADTAITICFNPEYESIVETTEQALKKAIENVKPDMPTSKLGAVIEKAITTRGFKPISNLTGHQIGRYLIHAGTSLPNVSQLSFPKIKLGEVYAIEPFVTLPQAVGRVEDLRQVTIFRFVRSKSLKNLYAKKLLRHIEEHFRTLPFAERWLKNIVPEEQYHNAFQELLAAKAIMGYPVFVEISRKPVAQAEHTVLIVNDGCEVLT